MSDAGVSGWDCQLENTSPDRKADPEVGAVIGLG
jgi:hypothetical protein